MKIPRSLTVTLFPPTRRPTMEDVGRSWADSGFPPDEAPDLLLVGLGAPLPHPDAMYDTDLEPNQVALEWFAPPEDLAGGTVLQRGRP